MNEILHNSLESARALDTKAHIVGSFVVEQTRSNSFYAPKFVTDSLVGLELPMRHPRFLKNDFVGIEHDDLIPSLLIQGRELEANWFNIEIERRKHDIGEISWGFSPAAGRYVLDSAVSADGYYRYLAAKYRDHHS